MGFAIVRGPLIDGELVPPPAPPVTPPPPPQPPPAPPPVAPNVGYQLLNPPPPPVAPPPPISSELPLPGGAAQIPGLFVPSTPAAPAPQPPPAPSGLDQAIADWNMQPADTSPLPDWQLVDPFGIQLFSTDSLPLKGQAALDAITAACDLYGVDVKAACADGLGEGFGGGIGDSGSAFGPWQEHLLDGRIREFAGKPLYSPTVQAWAWSPNGIAHGVRGMAVDTPSARGKHGHAAVYAIVYGFERPADKPGAYAARAGFYDHLVSLGDGWQAYVAGRLAGPSLGTAATIGGQPVAAVTPTRAVGPTAAWREVLHLLAAQIPSAGTTATRIARRVG